MPSYSEQIESLITSRDASASEILIELFNGYLLESKKFHHSFHHALTVESMLLRLKSAVPRSEAVKVEEVLQKLNTMCAVTMNKQGDFLGLFNAFFAFYPGYLCKLFPAMHARLQPQPFLFTAEKDAEATINALIINSNAGLNNILAVTLVDLVPVTFQELQRKIVLRLLTTTAVVPLIRLIELAPENYRNEIFDRLLTLLDNSEIRFLGAVSVSLAERFSIIKLFGAHASDLQRNTRTRATLFLLSCFAVDDLVLIQAAADSLYQIILTLSGHDQDLMLNNIRLIIQKYLLESADIKKYY
jgi:hypothetical protein